MCGRFVRYAKESLFADLIPRNADSRSNPIVFSPRYNISPGTPVEFLRREGGQNLLDFCIWGLLPSWSKDPNQRRYVNARIESIEEKASFRLPFLQRRCLIQAEGYYEWKTSSGKKIPYFIYHPNLRSFALGGIWDIWMGRDGSEEITLSLITRQANNSVRSIHDRMPLVIENHFLEEWLDPSRTTREIQKIIEDSKDIPWNSYRVSQAVNQSRMEGSNLIQELPENTSEERGLFDF